MILGSVPLVYACGRNAAIGTVICSAVILVVLILLCCHQETDGFSVRAPNTNEGGKGPKGPAEKYPFWNFVQNMWVVIDDSYARHGWMKTVLIGGGVICAFLARLLSRSSSSNPHELRIVISHDYLCGVSSLQAS